MLTIYGIPTLNTVKVVLTAEWLELDYDYVPMDFSKGEHKTPEHLARHPLGKVPVIEHDGKPLFESNAISVYLAANSGTSLYPGEPWGRGQVHQWIDLVSFHPGRWLAEHYFEKFIKPTFLGGEADEKSLKTADGFLDQQLPALEQHLAGNEWLCGETLTVADLVAFTYFNTHEISGYSLADYPAISAWYAKIRQSGAYGRMAAKLGLPA
jgi:glutathione S-transferase